MRLYTDDKEEIDRLKQQLEAYVKTYYEPMNGFDPCVDCQHEWCDGHIKECSECTQNGYQFWEPCKSKIRRQKNEEKRKSQRCRVTMETE